MTNLNAVAKKLSEAIDAEVFEISENTPAFSVKTEVWAFVDKSRAKTFKELAGKISAKDLSIPAETTIVRFVVDYIPADGSERTSLGLGFEGVTLKKAIHQILDLPETFQETQSCLIEGALDPVADLPGGIIQMRTSSSARANNAKDSECASQALTNWIENTQASQQHKNLLFVEAEAGKGKTILLASTAKNINQNDPSKLAIYIPLRNLPLATGVSWDNITQLIGVVGSGAERLARAVRSGLVTLFLDGIDEVSGRYDRSIIKDLLSLLASKLSSHDSAVVISGRKTEAKTIEKDQWDTIGIELPEPKSEEFSRYVDFVIDKLITDWNDVVDDIPVEFAELLGRAHIDDQVLREKREISEWIISVFPVVGKDSSLFFVQGLAAIAIGRRAGNRLPLTTGKSRFIPTLVDVCNAAAVFACLREQTKIDNIAEHEYSASKQMKMLSGFSLLSSASSSKSLPTPNELTASVFEINTINDSEVYVAITRQNAKHALLYATEAVGNYQPHFLSDWVRCSFLARALHENSSIGNISEDLSRSIISSADRSRYVFSSFLPDILLGDSVPAEWLDSLQSAIKKNSETASANIWQLRAAVGDERIDGIIPNPLPLAQIDQAEFIGNDIGPELSGESFFLDASTFDGASLEGITFSGVSMQGVKFRDCLISNVKLQENCEGPIHFERCTFHGCTFHEMKSYTSPALSFVDCTFEGTNNSIKQETPAFGASRAEPFVCFENCITDDSPIKLINGDWLHIKTPPEGIEQRSIEIIDPAIQCLREVFNTFFPSRVGSGKDIQARRYIRLSALGRGRMPAGSPSPDELKSILESIGFADGGRSDHLYAPWSSVLGGTEEDRKIREEIIDFLLNKNHEGPIMEALLKKVRRYFDQ